ncbi:MAG: HAMP domain-containing protein [Candidatus Omnitrophota bacterium]
MSEPKERARRNFTIGIQAVYLLLLLPALGATTVVMGLLIHDDLYKEIELGFNRKLSAISLAVGAFIDGGVHDDLLRPHTLLGLTYVDSRRQLIGIDKERKRLAAVNMSDGSLQPIGVSATGVADLAYDSRRDLLYALQEDGRRIVVIDRMTSETTPLIALDRVYHAIAYHRGEDALYAAGADWLRIDLDPLRCADAQPLAYGRIAGMDYDESQGRFLAIEGDGGNLLAIDPATGNADVLGVLVMKTMPKEWAEEKAETEISSKSNTHEDELKENLKRIEEFDRLRRIGDADEIAVLRGLVEKIALYTANEVRKAETDAEDVKQSGEKTAVFHGLAWNPITKKWYASADRFAQIDPAAAVCWDAGWWPGYRSETSDNYLDYVLPMRRIWKKLNITYLCTFRRPEGGGANDEVYVLDVDYGGSHVPIGFVESFEEGEGDKVYGKIAVGGVYTSGVVNWGEWGLLKSGYAPIYDRTGNVRGVAGTDIDVSIIATKTRIALLKTISIGLFAFLAAGVVGYAITLALMKPIRQLIDKTLIVAAGRYGDEAPLQGPVELRELCGAFNRLSLDLKNFFLERNRTDEQLKVKSNRLKLIHVLKNECVYAASWDGRLCAGGAWNVDKKSTDISGCISHVGLFLMWAGSFAGETLDATIAQRMLIMIANTLLQRYGDDWEQIERRLSRLYPEQVAWFLLIDGESGRSHASFRQPASVFLYGSDGLSEWNPDGHWPLAVRKGEALIAISAHHASLLKKSENALISNGVKDAQSILNGVLKIGGDSQTPDVRTPMLITIMSRSIG